MKVLLGITGSSATNLGFKLAFFLQKKASLYIIITKAAKKSFLSENEELNIAKNSSFTEYIKEKYQLSKACFFDDDDLSAGPASGSFKIEKTIIAPTSLNSLAKIHAGLADSLLLRAAAVALKENKKLILAVRESPFNILALNHMLTLSKMGVIIAPPMYASYASKDLKSLESFIIGKWLDSLDIEHNLYKRWKT